MQLIAIAIITRWRMPPENSCGYALSRCRAPEMPTRSRRLNASARASRRPSPRWMRSGSAICSPIVKTGLRLDIGSWKIIEMSLPRSRPISRLERPSSSAPWNRIDPDTTSPGWGTRPRIDRHVTLLPEPDSPTSPSVSPARISNETPLAARTTPCEVANIVTRSRTLSRGSSPPSGSTAAAVEPWVSPLLSCRCPSGRPASR